MENENEKTNENDASGEIKINNNANIRALLLDWKFLFINITYKILYKLFITYLNS